MYILTLYVVRKILGLGTIWFSLRNRIESYNGNRFRRRPLFTDAFLFYEFCRIVVAVECDVRRRRRRYNTFIMIEN